MPRSLPPRRRPVGKASGVMDRRKELGDFLRAKRAQAPLPEDGHLFGSIRRRVPGLRREEVAERALISTTYYTKLERGKVAGISSAVLDGLVAALALTPEERSYVAALIPVTGTVASSGGSADADAVGPVLQRVLDGLTTIPVHVQNERCEIIASNAIGRALYPFHFEQDRPNTVRFLFLDPRARAFFVNWQKWADQGVYFLRSAHARDPRDARLKALIADLIAASPEFAHAWETHEVESAAVGTRCLVHPEVGRLNLDSQNLRIAEQPRLRLIAYTAEPGSLTEERLAKLAALSD